MSTTTKRLSIIACLLFASLPLFATERFQGGWVGGLSSTPQIFSTGVGKVNDFKIRVVPGECSKVYIGFSNMNLATHAGIIKILYPNCTGGLSDEWHWYDVAHTGTDCLDTGTIYLAADTYGTEVMWEATSTGVVAAQLLKPFGTQGPLKNTTNPNQFAYFGFGASYVETWIVPGMLGKVTTYFATTFNAPFKVNYPNNGSMNITDGWHYQSVSKNGIAAQFYTIPAITGEYMLLTQWKYM